MIDPGWLWVIALLLQAWRYKKMKNELEPLRQQAAALAERARRRQQEKDSNKDSNENQESH